MDTAQMLEIGFGDHIRVNSIAKVTQVPAMPEQSGPLCSSNSCSEINGKGVAVEEGFEPSIEL